MTDPEDEIALLFRLKIGPHTLPLRGKVPATDGWRTSPPVDEPTVRAWVEAGFNLGMKTGIASGFVVIDNDQGRHPDGPQSYVAPATGLRMRSSTGSVHSYFRAPTPCPGNTTHKIAPNVDSRGEGGYVVIPPSTHPVTRLPYRWEATGEPGQWPADTLPTKPTPAPPSRPTPTGQGYAEAALMREVHAVRTATEGTRNDTLNKAAGNLGQLVAGGELSGERVTIELEAAATMAGLTSSETAATIRSGLAWGATHPRTKPARPAPTQTATRPQPAPVAPASRDVLVPGSHVMPTGEYVEQGNHTFAAQTLAAIAPGTLYRRAGVLGEISDAAFVPITVNGLRSIVDGSVRLCAGKEGEDEATLVFRPCSRDHASVIHDFGQIHGTVRELRHLATHPVYIGPDFTLAHAGWNADGGVFLACADVPKPLPLAESRAVLEDIVADFPFATPADRANFFGLLLTPMLRPAINEPVPMHLIGSPVERTGKTKLAEIVLGVSIAGRRLPAMQLGDREEEREKRILSVLLRGQGLLHLDNLSDFLDSPSLASLLTSSEYQGRILGASSSPTIPNGLTVVGTGNNVHATGEIAKRLVPIMLLPASATPETRTDFRHPDLFAFMLAETPRVRAACIGVVEAWKAAGRPLHRAAFGGFERWTAVTGGILGVAGYPEWLSNMAAWRGSADNSGEEHGALVAAWHAKWGSEWSAASDVYALAVELDIYGWLDSGKTDRARRTAFGMRVLNRLVSRVMTLPREPGDDGPAASVRVESTGVGSRRLLRLNPSTSSTS